MELQCLEILILTITTTYLLAYMILKNQNEKVYDRYFWKVPVNDDLR